jgi:hypothetical protein
VYQALIPIEKYMTSILTVCVCAQCVNKTI